MIKSVQLTKLTKSKRDHEILIDLLESLGLRKGFSGENGNVQYAEFLPLRLKLDVIYRKKPWDDTDVGLWVQDPDSAIEIVRQKKLNVLKDRSRPEPSHDVRDFTVRLPDGTRINILGIRVDTDSADTDYLGLAGDLKGANKKFAIVVSRFNSFITERLLAGTIDGLVRCGVEFHKGFTIFRVPGSFEIPSAARTLAKTKKYDAIICLGCLLRGDTAHYDVIVNEVTRGIGQSAQETGVPHAFGVLTCDTLEQAIDRAGLKMGNKGFEAALAAVEMANLKEVVVGRSSLVVGKKNVVSRRPLVVGKSKNKGRKARRKRNQ
jgi:6,7-dimethyl-8-ribityllumazine synthase